MHNHHPIAAPHEAYTFGDNVTFNLGHSHATPRTYAERVDSLARANIFVSKVRMITITS